MNSLESLSSFIAEAFPVTCDQFEHDVHALLGRQAQVILPVRSIAFGMALELADDLLHGLIVPVPITASQKPGIETWAQGLEGGRSIYVNTSRGLTDNCVMDDVPENRSGQGSERPEAEPGDNASSQSAGENRSRRAFLHGSARKLAYAAPLILLFHPKPACASGGSQLTQP